MYKCIILSLIFLTIEIVFFRAYNLRIIYAISPSPSGTLIPTIHILPKYQINDNLTIPSSFNRWMEKGWIMNPMNQYGCGGCWSFAINGALADRYNIKYKGMFNRWLSPQWLISCDITDYNKGCEGSHDVEKAASDMSKHEEGTFLYSDYPFDRWKQKKRVNKTCVNNDEIHEEFYNCGDQCWNSDDPLECLNVCFEDHCVYVYTSKCLTCCLPENLRRFRTSNVRHVPSSHRNGITNAYIKHSIMTEGPVVTTFHVTEEFLDKIKSGFFKNGYIYDSTSQITSGHAVIIVGWGQTNTSRDYWIIKNSWGIEWGMNGYFYAYTNGFSSSVVSFDAPTTIDVKNLPPLSPDQYQTGDNIRLLPPPKLDFI